MRSCCREIPAFGAGRDRRANEAFRSHPPDEAILNRFDDGTALIFITESRQQARKIARHLGNPGSEDRATFSRESSENVIVDPPTPAL